MRAFLFTLFTLAMLVSCDNATTSENPAGPANTETTPTATADYVPDYEISNIPGTQAKMARLYTTTGSLQEAGPMIDGKKTGAWSYYGMEGTFPIKVISYVEDLYNGIYLEFNDRGQAELMATYKNNKLDGPWGKYRFGRAELTANYKDGELDGVLREYDFRNGNLKKEASYKAGELDGLVRDYDEEGNVMVEYVYRNGEKISGGVVE